MQHWDERSEAGLGVRMAELAIVRIHGPAPWHVWGNPMVIEVDGREVGRVGNGKDLVTYVESGRRNLRARQLGVISDLLELVLAPGEDAQLETRYETTNWGFTPRVILVRTDAHATVSTEQVAQVLGATEMHRSDEPIGTENLRIDNTSSVARLTRTMRITREWSRTVSLDLGSNHGSSADTRVGPAWLALRTTIEQSLSRTYAISENRREEFAEEFSIEVEPGAAVTIVLHWKRLWQHGVVHVLFHGRQVEVPFRVAVGITFDQSLR